VVLRKSPQVVDESRRKLLKEAKKKGRPVNPRTLEAAAYFFVLTSVPAEDLSAAQVLEMYRFRWQIEMAFKRFKEILPLRQVPVKNADLAKTYLLANLLMALLTEDLARNFLASPPEQTDSDRSPSLWRIQKVFAQALCQAILQLLTIQQLLLQAPRLFRFLVDSPRKRKSQAAQAAYMAQQFNAR
jgi:Transposase DDE domain